MALLRTIFIGPRGVLRSGWRLGVLLFGLTVAAVVVQLVLTALGAEDGTVEGVVRPVPLLVNSAALLGAVFVVYWLVMRFLDGRSPATMGLPLTRPWLGGLATGLGLGALAVALIVAVGTLAGATGISLGAFDLRSVLSVTLPSLLALFLVSSFEEMVLRGYPMQLVAEGAGPWVASVVSGAVFGLAHISNPGSNLLGLLNTGILGALLAWLVIRTGSLWIACGYHAGWNICGSVIFGMRLSGIDVPGAILHTSLQGPRWLSGGDYGFEGSTVAGIAELIVLACAVLFAPYLPGHPELCRYFRRWKREEEVEAPGETP